MKTTRIKAALAVLATLALLAACVAPAPQGPLQVEGPVEVEVLNAEDFGLFGPAGATERGSLLCATEDGNCVESWNGSDIVVYSDTGSTQTFLVDGATGTVDIAGSYTLSDATNEGAMFQVSTTITYGITSTVTVAVVPAGADMIDWGAVVTTAFDGSGTDLLNCGTAADADRWVDDLSVATAGRNIAGDAADMQQDEWSTAYGNLSASTTIICTYADQNNNATAGSVTAYFIYRTD